jgi:hypothetical protein
MRSLSLLALAVVFAGHVFAQATVDRTYRFRSVATEQDYQDLSTAALTMSGLKARSTDVSTSELSIRGTGDQIGVADWVVSELDRPLASTPPLPSNFFDVYTKEPENAIRVFYPAQISTNQSFNEVLTAVRTITDVRYVAAYTSHRAFVLRGSREQLELADWLLSEMNKDSPKDTYVFPSGRPEERHVRVFRYARGDVQQFNEVQTMIRTLTDTRRVYPYIAKRAIALRGSEEQLDMALWILEQVDKELPLAAATTSSDYSMKEGELMRMFYFKGSMSSQAFLDFQTGVRRSTGIRRVYPFASARTLAVRGTAAEISQIAALASQ